MVSTRMNCLRCPFMWQHVDFLFQFVTRKSTFSENKKLRHSTNRGLEHGTAKLTDRMSSYSGKLSRLTLSHQKTCPYIKNRVHVWSCMLFLNFKLHAGSSGLAEAHLDIHHWAPNSNLANLVIYLVFIKKSTFCHSGKHTSPSAPQMCIFVILFYRLFPEVQNETCS